MDSNRAREFEIAERVAELLDTLTKEQQAQVMAMLARRYGLILKEPSLAAGKAYSPRPKKGRW